MYVVYGELLYSIQLNLSFSCCQFTELDLSEIARKLDWLEEQYNTDDRRGGSKNMDDTGICNTLICHLLFLIVTRLLLRSSHRRSLRSLGAQVSAQHFFMLTTSTSPCYSQSYTMAQQCHAPLPGSSTVGLCFIIPN